MYQSISAPLKVYGNAIMASSMKDLINKATPADLEQIKTILKQNEHLSDAQLQELAKSYLEGHKAGALSKAGLALLAAVLFSMAHAASPADVEKAVNEKDKAGIEQVVEQNLKPEEVTLVMKGPGPQVVQQMEEEQQAIPSTDPHVGPTQVREAGTTPNDIRIIQKILKGLSVEQAKDLAKGELPAGVKAASVVDLKKLMGGLSKAGLALLAGYVISFAANPQHPEKAADSVGIEEVASKAKPAEVSMLLPKLRDLSQQVEQERDEIFKRQETRVGPTHSQPRPY